MLVRLLPRSAVLVVGVVLVVTGPWWLKVVGGLLVVTAVPPDPRAWWHRVRTGQDPELARRPPAPYAEPGRCLVVLGEVGARHADIIRAIREVADVGSGQARDWVETAPCAIAGGLSRRSADRVRERLEQAGATAWVEDGSVP